MKRTELLKEVRKISTVPDDVLDGEVVGHAVERLRDLIRRALLARICPATGNTPLWPLSTDEGVDATLVDNLQRQSWRNAWRDTLATVDAIAAADRPLRQVSSSGIVSDEDDESQKA